MDLTPKVAQKLFEGDGGSYEMWSSSDAPLLGEMKVGAGKLVLQPNGFALPHYADSSKLGYVLQGDDGLVGLIFPNTSEEVVIKVKQGDLLAVPLGALSWWFNNGQSPLEIVFLGDTTTAYIPGQFTYFFLAGAQSLLRSFSTEIISKTYNVTNNEADQITKSQSEVLIFKLDQAEKTKMPHPNARSTHQLVHHISRATLTEKEFPFLKQAGLSAKHIELEPYEISPPTYTTGSEVQVIYVVEGSGQVQIVGLNAQLVLDTQVTAGQLLVVPKLFMVAQLAGKDGLECISVITSSQCVLEDIAGKTSALGALSPEILQISLNISPQLEGILKSKITK